MNWEELDELDEDEFWDILGKLKPSDFYFQLEIGNPDDLVGHHFMITPKDYFDQTGALFDDHFPEHTLPKGFYCLMESEFEFDGDPQIGRQLLLSAGFIEKKMF